MPSLKDLKLSEAEQQELVKKAQKNSEKWIASLKTDGNPNVEEIQKILNIRTFEGKPVTAYVTRSPWEAVEVLKNVLAKEEMKKLKLSSKEAISNWMKERIKELQPWAAIWDYWDMAYSECIYYNLPQEYQEVEFLNQSLFQAFEHGLGFLINLSELVIGIISDQSKSTCLI